MRAIFIFFIFFILLQIMGCASVEVAKEVTKATKSIEASVKKILKPSDSGEEQQDNTNNVNDTEANVNDTEANVNDTEARLKIQKTKQKITTEQKKFASVVKKQKKISTINLIGKNMNELNKLIGSPALIREDGKITTARFDSKNCRLFVFINTATQNSRVEYYELRNTDGELINLQKKIELCFKEIKPV